MFSVSKSNLYRVSVELRLPFLFLYVFSAKDNLFRFSVKLSLPFLFYVLSFSKENLYKVSVKLRLRFLFCYVFSVPEDNLCKHYENTPIQIYGKLHLQKSEDFQINSDIFQNSAQNIDRGYSLEPPR